MHYENCLCSLLRQSIKIKCSFDTVIFHFQKHDRVRWQLLDIGKEFETLLRLVIISLKVIRVLSKSNNGNSTTKLIDDSLYYRSPRSSIQY